MTDVNRLLGELQKLLGLAPLVCGSLTLNINASELQSVKTEEYIRVAPKRLDKGTNSR